MTIIRILLILLFVTAGLAGDKPKPLSNCGVKTCDNWALHTMFTVFSDSVPTPPSGCSYIFLIDVGGRSFPFTKYSDGYIDNGERSDSIAVENGKRQRN